MDKMTFDAVALNRPMDGAAAPPSQSFPRLRKVDLAGVASDVQVGVQTGIQSGVQTTIQTGAQQRRAILTRAVQLQVIPQLLERPALRSVGSAAVIEAHVRRLAGLSLQATSHEVVDFVTGLMENGFDVERLYLGLLTPTAALLGTFWEDDLCTFADVTIGIGHLQTAMRALRPAFLNATAVLKPGAPRAILMPLPGEQHTFGLAMLSTFFTRAGWDTWSGTVATAGELDSMMRGDWIDLIGFSISHDALLDTARHQVAAIRASSRNPAVVVMVGGLPFAGDGALALAIGADGTAQDGAQAVATAARLLKGRAGPR
ncbi:MAG: cobalamin-dependent protein [Acetobacteraceae bacterium]|nr:cobalamin-dependent protein [Acetobacteraceae bacterium]